MENPETFKVISIDPGTDNLGFAVLDVTYDDFKIIKTVSKTITASKLVTEESWISQVHGYRMARIQKLKEVLINNFNNIEPAFIVCESPFFNPRMPGAFQPLAEILFAIKEAVLEHNWWLPLYLIDPSTIKKSVKAPGNADKTVMKKCVDELTDINYEGDVLIKDLDEHSIDAIAVGYCHVRNLREKTSR